LADVTTEKLRRNFKSESDEASMSMADEGNTSSVVNAGPTKDDNRTWRWTAENSCDDRPLTESTVKKKLSLLPDGIDPGIGEEERVDAADLLVCLSDNITLIILMSTRHEPMASAVYRQNIGTVEVDESRRDSGASDSNELPMKEYSGGGVS
jgi:hypothetical protein